MPQTNQPEVWLRGALNDVPALLQPVAHALLQAREEVNELMKHFPENKLWVKPAGVASAGFHLQHLTGVLNRLFAYAREEQLTEEQLNYLRAEGKPTEQENIIQLLIDAFNKQVYKALEQLRETDEKSLTAFRSVGRAQLPSTVIGLLFHAAEHTMRHVGQLLVTAKFVNE